MAGSEMRVADWATLVIQATSAVAAATAAIFAWRTARQVKDERDFESRLRASEHFKRIHRLITELVEIAHRSPSQTFAVQMHLRSELGVVTYVPLPKCLELVDSSRGDITFPELDRVANEAIAEVEDAQKAVWEGRIIDVIMAKTGPPTPRSGSVRRAEPGDSVRVEPPGAV